MKYKKRLEVFKEKQIELFKSAIEKMVQDHIDHLPDKHGIDRDTEVVKIGTHKDIFYLGRKPVFETSIGIKNDLFRFEVRKLR